MTPWLAVSMNSMTSALWCLSTYRFMAFDCALSTCTPSVAISVALVFPRDWR
ncbi:hypothetical protein PF005_g13903 [Phytophthora fragariae]|uniref:Uncharacterized protein n=1 Tax=Phytophthora fragariae TaxID=53985 RepID=A0A6A3JB62_9STRA|nr:hypothetical protein PF003_g17472 [Phytophthora fragariae]KAE8935025.1 hypothetical protein PF009_g15011 [Phytophthora fragariae]KAE8988833.1 hypothetical protein PF011_g19019 [Phytophthora fragariae]KAE9083285.1 hypothetical protein PF007_g21964 [Phytophthora fragariae]KAE9083599.1 hypothetical protein PF010_g21154 [Phytophthora fragariae]